MRVISGQHRGRKLVSLEKATMIRPTADRTREMIFNILLHRCIASLQGLFVLDGFAGTGALGFEALSRGAEQVVFVEKNPRAMAILKENGRLLKEQDKMVGYLCDLFVLPQAMRPCDLIFLDPPYGESLVPPALAHLHKQGWIQNNTWIVAEVGAQEPLHLPPSYNLKIRRTCSLAGVFFFRFQEEPCPWNR